jgi:hypothetical protein
MELMVNPVSPSFDTCSPRYHGLRSRRSLVSRRRCPPSTLLAVGSYDSIAHRATPEPPDPGCETQIGYITDNPCNIPGEMHT